MQIIETDFRLTPSTNDASLFWDLELLVDIKGKNPRKEFKNVGYGLTLESAIKKIANYRVQKQHEVSTLKKYLDEYKQELRKLYESINQ